MAQNEPTPDRIPSTIPPEQQRRPDAVLDAAEALAIGHDEQAQLIANQQEEINLLRGALERQTEQTNVLSERVAQLESGVVEPPDNRPPEAERTPDSRSDTQRDLERIASITGRTPDDPEVVKLHLRQKLEQFKKFSDSYDAQSGTSRQAGFMQDMATAKRELEEAMFVYDPGIRGVFEKEDKIKSQLSRTKDFEERRKLKQELRRLKDHGSVEGHERPRREMADRLTDRLDDIAGGLDGSEILATYELHKGDLPADDISSRRRTDTKDWRGRLEYDDNGVYIGSSPASKGKWILEPKPPIDSSDPEGAPPAGDPEGAPPAGGSEGAPPAGGSEGAPPETRVRDVPLVDPGDYPELYARRKNLVGGDVEALEAESTRVRGEIIDNVTTRVNNFRAENPTASPEEIRAFAMQCYVDTQNDLQGDIIAAIDGQGYTDASGNERGRSVFRRFGAWLDRHGRKLKIAMLAAGGTIAVALTGGVLSGLIVPAFAIGAGTAVGAAGGAAKGLLWSRHGSKRSESHNIDVTSGVYREVFSEMDPTSRQHYADIATYLMREYNASAEKDHTANVKRSRKAAILGTVIGAVAGSISFDTLVGSNQIISHTEQVPNAVPEIPHHTIQPGELTGQVINNTLSKMGIDGSKFVMPDGSTNLHALFDLVPRNEWASFQEMVNGTHSVAGADSLSNEGIRKVIETIVNNHDWGTHSATLQTVGSSFSMEDHLPATIGGWLSGALLAGGISGLSADHTGPRRNDGVANNIDNRDREDTRVEPPATREIPVDTVVANINRLLATGDENTMLFATELERRGWATLVREGDRIVSLTLTEAGRTNNTFF